MKNQNVRFNATRTRGLEKIASEIGYFMSKPVSVIDLTNAIVDCVLDDKLDTKVLSARILDNAEPNRKKK